MDTIVDSLHQIVLLHCQIHHCDGFYEIHHHAGNLQPRNCTPPSPFLFPSLTQPISSILVSQSATLSSLFGDGFHTLSSLTNDPSLPNLPEAIIATTANLNNSNKLLVPKTEHPTNILPPIEELEQPLRQQPLNFFPTYQQQQQQSFDTFHCLLQLGSPEPSFCNWRRLHHHFPTNRSSSTLSSPCGKVRLVIPQQLEMLAKAKGEQENMLLAKANTLGQEDGPIDSIRRGLQVRCRKDEQQ